MERLQRAEEIAESGDLDLSVLTQWIAFNSLYGQWDEETREPVADIVCWRHFLQRMLELDDGSVIVDTLVDNKPLVMTIFEDEFLSRYFWQEPSERRASKSKKTMYDARSWFVMGNWSLILDRTVERI